MQLRRTGTSLLAVAAVAAALATPASAAPRSTTKTAVAEGFGGAVATVDADATRVGLEVLRKGGNAVDAAVAAAATLGVTEPFSSGLGGGGFFVYYDAASHRVSTIDGREAAPESMPENAFQDAAGNALPFQQARISGVSAGVPGSPATWQQALDNWGTMDLRHLLQPAIQTADRGFLVDQTFHDQIAADPNNLNSFSQFSSTRDLYLPGGQAPAVGSIFRNPDLAATYQLLARENSVAPLYTGPIAADIVNTVQHPPVVSDPARTWPYPIAPGTMTAEDLARYAVRQPAPTHVNYRGLDVYGMPTPSSGGSTVGEALNILSNFDLGGMTSVQYLHHYFEASALAFADRNHYVGDYTPRSTLDALLAPAYGKERSCLIDPTKAATKPVPYGNPLDADTGCAAAGASRPDTAGMSTTNMTVADRWGNVVEYTLTIEQTGGNAMVVPGRGFLLNNELTDFSFTNTAAKDDPNMPAGGKRPRSSMSPTILLRDGAPYLAVGSPGGSTIITTVLQILLNRLDRGMTLPQAIAAPRAAQRNTPNVSPEPAFMATPEVAGLTALGHTFGAAAEIGAATGVEFLPDGRLLAAAEPVRRGGGAAGVVQPAS